MGCLWWGLFLCRSPHPTAVAGSRTDLLLFSLYHLTWFLGHVATLNIKKNQDNKSLCKYIPIGASWLLMFPGHLAPLSPRPPDPCRPQPTSCQQSPGGQWAGTGARGSTFSPSHLCCQGTFQLVKGCRVHRCIYFPVLRLHMRLAGKACWGQRGHGSPWAQSYSLEMFWNEKAELQQEAPTPLRRGGDGTAARSTVTRAQRWSVPSPAWHQLHHLMAGGWQQDKPGHQWWVLGRGQLPYLLGDLDAAGPEGGGPITGHVIVSRGLGQGLLQLPGHCGRGGHHQHLGSTKPSALLPP